MFRKLKKIFSKQSTSLKEECASNPTPEPSEWDFKYFSRSEFACKCGCGKDDVDLELVTKLDEIRGLLKVPLIVTSGCRCPEHNKRVGSTSPNSAHVLGKAADIQISDSHLRWGFLLLAFRKFSRIGIAKSFIHVDVDRTKPRPRCWLYTDKEVR